MLRIGPNVSNSKVDGTLRRPTCVLEELTAT